jgi:hypothetical protein
VLGLHAAALDDLDSALGHLGDAVTRSRPQRGGHLWSHVWALTDAVRTPVVQGIHARGLGETRA